jgi:hypothetical protein
MTCPITDGEHRTIGSPAVSSVLLNLQVPEREGAPMLFVGDDWSEDHHAHHDVEVVDDQGSVLARGRLPEGSRALPRCMR